MGIFSKKSVSLELVNNKFYYAGESSITTQMHRLHNTSVRDRIELLCEDEKIQVSPTFIENFLNILSRLCNYEEEGHKIRPRLIVSRNIRDAVKTVTGSHLIKTRLGDIDGSDMEKQVKSLIPFCNNGWHVVIDIQKGLIQYGIVRSFSGPIGLPITENLFAVEDLNDVNYSIVEIKAINSFELNLCGLYKNSLTIDSRYLEVDQGHNSSFPLMVEDLTQSIEDPEHREIVRKAFSNLFRVIPYKVHGTICVIVDVNYSPNAFFEDGIWFEEPIVLGSKIIDSVVNNKDVISAEAYYGLSGLFLEMLNVDGMTIVDTAARVRGFNIFVKKAPEGVTIPNEGGARKRAANTVLLSGEPDIVGVYFLSQDGNSFYKRVGK